MAGFCKCRAPRQPRTHDGDGFSVSLNVGFGNYHTSRKNPRTGKWESARVPATIRNNWRGAMQWVARYWQAVDACAVVADHALVHSFDVIRARFTIAENEGSDVERVRHAVARLENAELRITEAAQYVESERARIA